MTKDTTDIVKLLDWDSDFFGFPIAQITQEHITSSEMAQVMEFCRIHEVRLLQFKCDAHDRESIHIAEANRFHFADMRMILDQWLSEQAESRVLADELSFRVAVSDDVPTLMDIADNLYIHSRYYFDTNFPRPKVHEFYRDWVRKAVFSLFDDIAWVLCENASPIAFCTARLDNSESVIGLVGLHPASVGRGLGQIVIANTLADLARRGVRQVTVTTQGRNYPAQRLYQRSGFTISRVQIYYHRWFGVGSE